MRFLINVMQLSQIHTMKLSLFVSSTYVAFLLSVRIARSFTSRSVAVKQVKRSMLVSPANQRAGVNDDEQKIPFDFSALPLDVDFLPPWKPSTPFVCEDT
jgi:hypothetical protein